MKYILAGIDGTGSREWRRHDGMNSHVYRFVHDFRADHWAYWHGPGTLGLEMGGIVTNVTEWIFGRLYDLVDGGTRQEDIRIWLVGHSRGCVAAMHVANRLENYLPVAILPGNIAIRCPIRIQFMGLYDSVDRSPMASPSVSLPNVDHIYHAIRANRSWSGSRWSFGSVGVARAHARTFDTAHGGIGGDPGFFDDPTTLAGDTYCNAMTLVLSDVELLQRYGYITVGNPYGGGATSMPRFTQLTGTARHQRIADIRTRWRASWDADVFMRAAAASVCETHRFVRQSPHHPFLVRDGRLASRLAAILGFASLSH